MDGEWSFYRRWSLSMEGELWYGGGQFNGGWSCYKKEGEWSELVTLMDREWSCYGGGQYKEGRMVML